MTEAIGRRVDDYLVKPTSPRQVLSVVKRVLEGTSIRQQRVAQDLAARFPALSRMCQEARTADDFARAHTELVDWQLTLGEAGEQGLLDTVHALVVDLRRDFGTWVMREYPRWVRGAGDRPPLSVDVVREFLVPWLGDEPVYFVVLDCMRLDQWRAMTTLLAPFFEIEETYHYSILPTATPYARNALFSGMFPDEIARRRPEWWDASDDEGSLNAFEDELLAMTVGRLELTRIKSTPEYQQELEAFKKERARPMSFAEAKGTADRIRNAFTDEQRKAETATELVKVRQAPDVDEQYRRWLKVKLVEPELATNVTMRDQLYEEAKRRNVKGRSKMTKAELERALSR